MDGFIVLDKPTGVTSHDMVRLARRMFSMRKIGHTGTLDPFATGVLPLALGEGTKAIPFLDESVKEYHAVVRLGSATDTQDYTGVVIKKGDWHNITSEALSIALKSLTGVSLQLPPMFSALKHNGVPLYRYARRGETLEREARKINIYSLSVERLAFPDIDIFVRCSRGTYVRTLAHDLGELLGCGAHLIQLRRTKSGIFDLSMAFTVDMFSSNCMSGEMSARIISPFQALSHIRDLPLNDIGVLKIARGLAPSKSELVGLSPEILHRGEKFRLSQHGRLYAVAESLSDKWQPSGVNLRLVRVFNLV